MVWIINFVEVPWGAWPFWKNAAHRWETITRWGRGGYIIFTPGVGGSLVCFFSKVLAAATFARSRSMAFMREPWKYLTLVCCLFSRPSNSRSGSALQVRLARRRNKTKLTDWQRGGGEGWSDIMKSLPQDIAYILLFNDHSISNMNLHHWVKSLLYTKLAQWSITERTHLQCSQIETCGRDSLRWGDITCVGKPPRRQRPPGPRGGSPSGSATPTHRWCGHRPQCAW